MGEIAEEVTDATVKYMEGDSTAQNSSWGKAADNVGKISKIAIDRLSENMNEMISDWFKDSQLSTITCVCDFPRLHPPCDYVCENKTKFEKYKHVDGDFVISRKNFISKN